MASKPIADSHALAEVDAAAFARHDFDFIVCGGGTAGLTVAARLSENPDVLVGIIEAGGNQLNNPVVDTPALFGQMFNNSKYDWQYMTTPQRGNMKEKEHHVVRGKMLGGSSGINYMMYVRGSDQDYDDWAALSGDQGWSSANMKQYMRKHQTLDPIDPSVKDRSTMPFVGENHGLSGPIHTSFNPWKLDIEDDIVKAADQASGFSKKPIDPWSGDHIGFYHTLAAIDRTGSQKGKRSYAARGYYEAVAHRSNLKVVTNALVTRILLDGDQATGVVFESKGHEYQAKVRREVIVSGGVINSPQILELSGIGNPEILRAAGIEPKIENRAIGENFQDHVVVAQVYETTDGVPTLDSIAKPEIMQAALKSLTEEANGPLTCTSTVQGFFPYGLFASEDEQAAVIKSIEQITGQTDYQKKQRATVIGHLKDSKSANLQLVLIAATPDVENGNHDQSKIFAPNTDPTAPNCFTLALCLQYPVSRGHVHVKSSGECDNISLSSSMAD
jgi:choline dehydrogenase-like flavoprotein